MPEPAFLITVFVTLFVVIDPIGLAPLFLALTQGMDRAQRVAVGLRACVISVVLLMIFGLAGEAILGAIGITMPAFQIAGGILLFLIALDMVFERRSKRREGHATSEDDPSVFPLAMPLIAGPGAMAAMILLVGETDWQWTGVAAVHLAMVAVIALAFILFLLAIPLERALGKTGTMVITRLLGILLAALSVQFVLNGLRGAGLV
ncbi:MarC family protein [Pararhodobacter sp. SW119]|uniref:MarC family protein n=1 Tax=Pararhodobacter sp. SW119 TaxID=2780075 RepID=UPI001ADED3D0|nr:MarC family protein [Pararhodobacter sp. SW119]